MGYDCDVTLVSTTVLQYTAGQLRVFSPGYGTQTQYPNDRLCLYSLPQCLGGVQQISWTGDTFVLEDPGSVYGICPDTVELIGLSPETLRNGGATLQDPIQENALCGDQGDFAVIRSAGHPIHVSIICI